MWPDCVIFESFEWKNFLKIFGAILNNSIFKNYENCWGYLLGNYRNNINSFQHLATLVSTSCDNVFSLHRTLSAFLCPVEGTVMSFCSSRRRRDNEKADGRERRNREWLNRKEGTREKQFDKRTEGEDCAREKETRTWVNVNERQSEKIFDEEGFNRTWNWWNWLLMSAYLNVVASDCGQKEKEIKISKDGWKIVQKTEERSKHWQKRSIY